MEKKKMIEALNPILTILMAGCGLNASPARPFPTPCPAPTHSIAADPGGGNGTTNDYYPLKEGAAYVYRHSENGLNLGTLTINFHDVATADGVTNALADRKLSVLSGPQPVRTDHITLNAESLDFAYYQDNGSVYNRFRLPLKVGSKWTFSAQDGAFDFSVPEIADAQTPLRTFKGCAHLYARGENNLVITESDYWLAPNVGLVYYRFRQTIQGEKSPYVEVVDELSEFH